MKQVISYYTNKKGKHKVAKVKRPEPVDHSKPQHKVTIISVPDK